MRSLVAVCAAAVALLGLGGSAWALPTYSPTCTQCHLSQAGHSSVIGQTKTVDLGKSRLDKLRVGAVKTFVIKAGTTGTISVNVTNGSSVYAVALEGFSKPGILTSVKDLLRYTPDARWKATGKPAYFVSSLVSSKWTGKAVRLDYKLTINSKTPPDYYELYVYTSGRGSMMWTQFERIYVQVTR